MRRSKIRSQVEQPTIQDLVDDLNAVRDLIEQARTATNQDAVQSALRRAHAALSKTERDLYLAANS